MFEKCNTKSQLYYHQFASWRLKDVIIIYQKRWLVVQHSFTSSCNITSDPLQISLQNLESPHKFVEAHLANFKKKQEHLCSKPLMIGIWRLFSMDTVEESVELKLPSARLEGKVRSCNGLVCLSNEGCDIICI